MKEGLNFENNLNIRGEYYLEIRVMQEVYCDRISIKYYTTFKRTACSSRKNLEAFMSCRAYCIRPYT